MSQRAASRSAKPLYLNFLRQLARVNRRAGAAFDMYERGGRGAVGAFDVPPAEEGADAAEGTAEDAEEVVAVPVRRKRAAEQVPVATTQLDPKKYHTDIPLPEVLLRHVREPSAAMQDRARITGFRIELNGRLKGSDRGMKQDFAFGKLGTNDFANRHVDYGKSFFVSRRGTIGVKVWVGFER